MGPAAPPTVRPRSGCFGAGLDEDGTLARVRLIERNVLLAGEPGSGKSVALSILVAAAALDPSAKL